MMRLKLLAFAILFAAPVLMAAQINSLSCEAAELQAVQMRDQELSRRLAQQQNRPNYTPPAEAVMVSMLD